MSSTIMITDDNNYTNDNIDSLMTSSTNTTTTNNNIINNQNYINIHYNKGDTIPNEFICPITNNVMFDPLLTIYGHTYEKSALILYLYNYNNTCPLTRKELNISNCIHNRILKNKIYLWYKIRGIDYNTIINNNDNDKYHSISKKDSDSMTLSSSSTSLSSLASTDTTSSAVPDILLTCTKIDLIRHKNNKSNTQNEKDEEAAQQGTQEQPQQQIKKKRNIFRFIMKRS